MPHREASRLAPAPSLLANVAVIESFVRCKWSESHGAERGFLGVGMVYYALAYSTRAALCVCLGSGGGFVPRLMRTAQHDCGIGPVSRTIVIDANKPEVGWGSPEWIDENSEFRRSFDGEIRICTTAEAAATWPAGDVIDYLHIDADHSYAGCRHDAHAFLPRVRRGGLITMHDTLPNPRDPRLGVAAVMKELKKLGMPVISLPIAAGTVILQIAE